MPSEQAKAVARQVLKTWWFWFALAGVVWVGLLGLDKLTAFQTTRFQEELSRTASNQLSQSIVTISNAVREQVTRSVSNQLVREWYAGMTQVSNQVSGALQQPNVQSLIQSTAARQAAQMMQTSITPAVSNFQARLGMIQAQLLAEMNSLTNIQPPPPAPAPAAPPKPAVKPAAATPDTPGTLTFASQSLRKQGSTYVSTLVFKKSGTKPLGILNFTIGVANNLNARIVGIDAANDAALAVEKSIDSTGLEAVLNFSTPEGVDPMIQVMLSGPTLYQVVSPALPEPLTVRAFSGLPTNAPATQ